MIKRIWRFFRGYILVELRGNALERLLNRLSSQGISLWNIQRVRHGFTFHMKAGDFQKVRALVRYRKCTLEIIGKYGLPFIGVRLKRRTGLLAGVVAFFIILKIFSSFLWTIDVVGNDSIQLPEIQELISQAGIRRGMPLSKVDLLKLEDTLSEGDVRISWVDVRLRGTHLTVEIVEKTLLDERKLTDVIASHSGVITQLIVLKGKAMIEEGETVQAGQILIKAANKYESFAEPDYEGNLPPYLPSPDEEPDSAKGIVRARVWFVGYGEAEYISTREIFTGNRERVIKVKIGSHIFHFSGPREIKFTYYQTEKEVKSIPIWRNISLPIEIIKEDYLETVIVREKRSHEAALFYAQEAALTSILNSLPQDAIIIRANYSLIDPGIKENNIVRVKAVLEIETDIAKPLPR